VRLAVSLSLGDEAANCSSNCKHCKTSNGSAQYINRQPCQNSDTCGSKGSQAR
jgi:hypothetical protein